MLAISSSTGSSTPTPGSSSSASNTLEQPRHNLLTQQHQHQQQHQQQLQHQHNNNSSNNSRPTSRTPSILDSPTLARVERARLRLEAAQHERQSISGCGSSSTGTASTVTTMNRENSLERNLLDTKRDAPWHQMWTHMKRLSNASKVNSASSLTAHKTDIGNGKCILFPDKTSSLKHSMYNQQVYFRPDMQSLLTGRIPIASMTGPIKRGLLWQQRDRLFSRWKERYFVLTRDYLHCFKRSSGSANERASDMGQFIFKIKLVDVEKVEWLNKRSYSVIGLLLGREGRVLLRCDDGLEDWFELIEECTMISKERRHALKMAQSPRSRASLAAPVSHATLQSQHYGLGGNYRSALEDWLITNGSGIGSHKINTNGINSYSGANPFLFSDSVPDLSALNNENHNHLSGISTNHSTPQKLPCHHNANSSRYLNGYSAQNNVTMQACNGLYGTPRRIFINSNFGANTIVDEETEEHEVQLRRPRLNRILSTDNDNELDRDWLYRKPRAPTDMRHSVQPILPTHNTSTKQFSSKTQLDHSAHDSGLDSPRSTHRPSSYRELPTHNSVSTRDSTETNASSSRGTLHNSPNGCNNGSFRNRKINQTQLSNSNQLETRVLHGSRVSVHERVLKIRNEELANRLNHSDLFDANQNGYYNNNNSNNINNNNGNQPTQAQHTPVKLRPNQSYANGNDAMAMAH